METITLNPAQFHLLSLVASAQGLTVEEYVSITLNRLFRSLAELQGICPAPGVEPEQVHAPGASGVSAPRLTRAERRAARRSARDAELERQRAAYAAPLTPATEPHTLRVEGYDPEFTPNPENFGQL